MAPGRRPTVNRNPPVNRSTNRNNVDINSGIDTQMLDQLIATRVAEALAAAAVTHAASTQEENNLGSNSSQNKTCNYKEFRAVMHENFRGTEGAVGLTRWFEKLESQFGISNVAEGDRVKFASSTLLDGALTWWNVYVRSVTLDTAHATPWSDFKAMFIRKYCPRNEIKQMENELWNLKVKGTNLTAYNQRFQELILLCPEMVPNPDRLLERYIEGLPLSIKGNVTSSKPVDLHEAIEMTLPSSPRRQQGCLQLVKILTLANCLTAESVDNTTLTHALLLVTTIEGQDIESKTVEPHLVLSKGRGNQIRGNQQYPQNNQRQDQGNPKGNNQASTSTQGGRIAPGRVYSLCAEAAVKDINVVNEHHAEVVCYEKYIRVPYGNDMLIMQGERSGVKNESILEVISSIRTQRYFDKGCQVFLIQMMKKEETEAPERRTKDVPVIGDFPEVYPGDLPGLPPTRQVEFHIELITRAAPVARAPYRLAPVEMKELAEQLKELFDKGFIRPSSSLWGAPILFVKKKDGSF
ncbi:putative reverse transcriptase domain-containing protein [Tanacetum coccineum]